jgi:peptidoglycan/LPS O-acetylase OafA/YrhL
VTETKASDLFKVDNHLEALRGFAAVFVVIQHIITEKLDGGYHPNFLNAFVPPGNLCVLIFFTLSGYVIGISNKQDLTSDTIATYAKKRFVRIYPIYFVSIILALIVAKGNYSLGVIVSNLFLLQDLVTPVIWENSPVWSLHYEIVYYLIFIPISYYRINPFFVLALSIALSFINYFLYPTLSAPMVSTYLNGLAFWVVGLIIAKRFTLKENQVKWSLLLSNIFLLLSMRTLHITATIFNNVSKHLFKHYLVFSGDIYWAKTKVELSDLLFIPYCLMFIANFSNINFKFKRPLFIFLQILPLLSIYTVVTNLDESNKFEAIISICAYVISIILFVLDFTQLNNLSQKIMEGAKEIGSISYGLYILHFPVLWFFSQQTFFSGTLYTFIVRLLLFAVLVCGISYVLEKKFQPWIKRVLLK